MTPSDTTHLISLVAVRVCCKLVTFADVRVADESPTMPEGARYGGQLRFNREGAWPSEEAPLILLFQQLDNSLSEGEVGLAGLRRV